MIKDLVLLPSKVAGLNVGIPDGALTVLVCVIV